MLRPRLLLLFLLSSVSLLAQNGDRPNEVQAPPPPDLIIPPAPTLLAEEALATLRVANGYRVEIAAADPLIGDPVAMAFGPDGRLWVVEMRGFMPDADGHGEDAPVGAIAVLEDTDHDGRMDRRTVFLDGLVLPRAFALVGDGVLVAEPPHLWFARDTDGDGRADEKIEVANDYGAAGNPEHTANGLLRALDNWIYSADHNVRFRYLGAGRFQREFTIMRGQWGIAQDDAGRLFYNTNSDPLRYDAVPAQYLARNPALNDPDGLNVQVVPANLRIWPLRVTPGVNRGYRTLDATGRITAMTAACAPLIQRSEFLPGLTGDAFVAEPAGNLIKRIILDRTGDQLTGHNAYPETEFLASTDERFRPVNLAGGPDGAIYIVDMYRGIIQHRIYLTSYLRNQIADRGLAEGLGMGRIYRVVPASNAPATAPFNLLTESSSRLIARLTSANGWFRDTAQRLLVERRDTSSVSPLRQLALNPAVPAIARVHALWTLEGVDGLDRDTLLAALDDTDVTVCATAIRLSEKLLATGDREIFSRVVGTMTDTGTPAPYAIVLQQCLSLGEATDARALPALLRLARAHGNRPAIADAIVSGLAGRETAFVALALQQTDPGEALSTLTLAASCQWRAENSVEVARLDALLAAPGAPVWAATCLLDSLNRIVPVRSDGTRLTARLATAPAALVRLAATASPQQDRATELLAHLRWPGHEGVVAQVTPLTAEQELLFEKGRTVFMSICAGCHQPTGLGLKGLAPPLVNSKWVAGDERALARIVLGGKAREGAMMPPLAALDDESLAGALTFVRRSWGHGFDPVPVDLLTRTRRETADRTEPWSDQELSRVVGAGQPSVSN